MRDVKLTRTYGPLSPIHLKMIQDQLDLAQSQYQIFTDQDLLAKAQSREKNSPEASPHLHNMSPVNLKEYLYIDIPLHDILIVRHLLVKLGFEQTPDLLTAQTLQAEEFICPQCQFVQAQPGYCPKHHQLLIPYFDSRRKDYHLKKYINRFLISIGLGLLILIVYFSLKQS